jgi:pyrimidine-nucleoside phosphorylase
VRRARAYGQRPRTRTHRRHPRQTREHPRFLHAAVGGRFRELVATLGCGLIGQTAEIAPADKRLYALRDVTATVESIPLIASSIMSKKLAEGIDALVLDVKVGNGAFMRTAEQARELARTMADLGAHMGKAVVAYLTDMNQPLGQAIGNALEVRETIDVLRGCGPADVRELTLVLAEEMLRLGGVDPARAREALESGAALARFREIVEAQGGDPAAIDDPSRLPTSRTVEPFVSPASGYLVGIDTRAVGTAAICLGAGRNTKDDVINPAVGFMMNARLGDAVTAGEPLLFMHHDGVGVEAARALLAEAFTFGPAPLPPTPLVLERIGSPIA